MYGVLWPNRRVQEDEISFSIQICLSFLQVPADKGEILARSIVTRISDSTTETETVQGFSSGTQLQDKAFWGY